MSASIGRRLCALILSGEGGGGGGTRKSVWTRAPRGAVCGLHIGSPQRRASTGVACHDGSSWYRLYMPPVFVTGGGHHPKRAQGRGRGLSTASPPAGGAGARAPVLRGCLPSLTQWEGLSGGLELGRGRLSRYLTAAYSHAQDRPACRPGNGKEVTAITERWRYERYKRYKRYKYE